MSTVTDINIVDGDEGSDTLTGIERISFADVVMDIGALPGPRLTSSAGWISP